MLNSWKQIFNNRYWYLWFSSFKAWNKRYFPFSSISC